MGEPKLDHTSWSDPGKTSVVIELLPDCEVCGQRMHNRFLRNWNEKRVCKTCIENLTAEVADDDLP